MVTTRSSKKDKEQPAQKKTPTTRPTKTKTTEKEKTKKTLPESVTDKPVISKSSFKPLTAEQEKLLDKLYFKDHMYFGRDRLFQYVRTNFPDERISRRALMDWLKKREVSQLFSPSRKRKDIAHTVLSRPYQQIGIDLMDMSSKETKGGYKWILSGIDLFSKKGWTIPMLNKEEATALVAFQTMLQQMDKKPESIRSDNGSEFINDKFKTFLKDQGINQVLSKPNSPQSNGQVERFNGIIKRLIKMYITQTDDQDWVGVLPKLVSNYNSTQSRVTGAAPNVVEVESKEKQQETKKKIEKAVLPKNRKETEVKFEVGDKVRLKLMYDKIEKREQNWSDEIYTVAKIFRPRKASVLNVGYQIKNEEGELIKEKYYNEDLQRIGQVKDPIKKVKKFILSKLIKPLMFREGKKYIPSYEVKWKGYRISELNTREGLLRDVPKQVRGYEKTHNVKWTKTKVTYTP